MGKKRDAYKVLVGKPERKGPIRRTHCRLVCDIRMELWEIEWEYMDWMHLAQDREQWWALVNMVMNL
jgi:hypothetical protein